jgi:hypothetical protein
MQDGFFSVHDARGINETNFGNYEEDSVITSGICETRWALIDCSSHDQQMLNLPSNPHPLIAAIISYNIAYKRCSDIVQYTGYN